MKQLEHTLKTYVYSHYNSAIFRYTFVTLICNRHNISLKHLKHLKHTLETCAFSKTWQASGWSTTQRDPAVGRQLHGHVVSDGAPGEWLPQWRKRTTAVSRCGLARRGDPVPEMVMAGGCRVRGEAPHAGEGHSKRQSRWRSRAAGERWGMPRRLCTLGNAIVFFLEKP